MDELALQERDKYRRMWAVPEYARYSPGEKETVRFIREARPNLGQSVIDLGSGTGRGAAVLANAAAATRIGGYFSIYLGHDGFGRMIDEVLHVTVKPPEWWADRLGKHFKKVRLVDVDQAFKAMVYV